MGKTTKAEEVLRYIDRWGVRGASLKDIQGFILRMNGRIGAGEDRPRWGRGYWCDYLYGTGCEGHIGLLNRFCLRNAAGRWVLGAPIKGPFSSGKENRLSRLNYARRKREWKARVASWPKCPNCGEHMRDDPLYWAPDKQTHITSWGLANIDCRGQVWFEGRLTGLDRDRYQAGEENIRTVYTKAAHSWEREKATKEAWLRVEADDFEGRGG